MRRPRAGQATTEYALLLCSAVVLANLAAGFLRKWLPELTERLLERIMQAALALALP